MKKVLLISPRFYKGRYRLSLHPLVGLGYISESLRTNGFSVEVFDMNLQYEFTDFEQKISDYKPDIIGFTVMTFGHKDVYETIRRIKKIHPRIEIVAGGPHISLLREKVMQDCFEIDYGIILEGDLSMIKLCNGTLPEKIPGLIYHGDGKVVMNNFSEFIADLDSLSFPKYESFELDKYPTGQIGIVTSRGCPYDCIYCPVISAIGKKFRQRSAESVANEIEYWYTKGYREILVLDDNFTLSRQRVEEICDLLAKKNLIGMSLKCPNGLRGDRVDYELLKKMRNVGFDMLAFGVEAAEDRILKNIKKGENIGKIEESIRNACDLGFDVDLFFIIGSPGETLSDVKSSFSLAMRYPVRSARFYNIIPFPTTELFKWIKENNYFTRQVEEILNNASHFINEPCFFTPEMSVADRRKAFKMGQHVSRIVRRRFIERKLSFSVAGKKIFSWLYTYPLFEETVLNNAIFLKMKEKIKKINVSGRVKALN